MSQDKISPEDNEKLKVFLGLYVDWFLPKSDVTMENHPLAVLVKFEKESLTNAKRGLQMAINDIVEFTADWRPEQVAEADAKFASHGTFTLFEIRRRYSRKYLQVLKRGMIRSKVEYYLLKGILDSGSIEPGATETQQIQSLMAAFEAKITQSVAKK